MAYCKNCGVEVAEGTELCPECYEASENTAGDIDNVEYPGSHRMHVGRLTLSILVTVLFYSFNVIPIFSWLGLALGVLGIVFTVLAKTARTEEEEYRHLRRAAVVTVLGTIMGVITLLIVLIPILIAAAILLFYVIYVLVALLLYVFAMFCLIFFGGYYGVVCVSAAALLI